MIQPPDTAGGGPLVRAAACVFNVIFRPFRIYHKSNPVVKEISHRAVAP